MTPTERLLTILRHLKEAGESDAGTSAVIQQAMSGEYRGQSGKRKWRRDIQALSDRRLIRTDLPPNRTGIRLAGPRKPERLHLSWSEHDAINRAREVLRAGISDVSPLGEQMGDDRAEVDDVTRILRFLEEEGDEVSLAQLAQGLNVSEQRAFELVDVLTADGVFIDGLVATVEFGGYEEAETEDPRPSSVWVLRGRNRHGSSPTRGRGMDELGFFPYSLVETNDRIDLIDRALASGSQIPDEIHEALYSARRKLSEWRVELER
ncbi:hypothetical protein ACNQVK_02845 [Mycobacterium sp. 134]|uniref:hypothetical protein n=1 Tax=Mycobacterium sp. 134 TaxID=3400425 RepID=UPI003AADD60C